MKQNPIDFAKALQSFFEDYSLKERGFSTNTIRAYAITFCQLIDFFKEDQAIEAEDITLDHLCREKILLFLDWIESKRECSVTTRNQKLAAICSFCKYMLYRDPQNMFKWKQILEIRVKRYEQKTIGFLSIEAIKVLLEQIDTSSAHGRRDLTLLSLLYNSGARVQELIDLTPSNLRYSKPYLLELKGKWNKNRLVPLNDAITGLLMKYIKENGLDHPLKMQSPLFFNSRGEKLTNPGITFIINKYVGMAKILRPELYPDKIKVTPHVFRHSRAMHLLQSGVNLIYIRDLLGHVSIQTTEIYARADSKHMRAALEKAYEQIGIQEPTLKSWEKDPELKAYLKKLSK